jgi:hypothetical protein
VLVHGELAELDGAGVGLAGLSQVGTTIGPVHVDDVVYFRSSRDGMTRVHRVVEQESASGAAGGRAGPLVARTRRLHLVSEKSARWTLRPATQRRLHSDAFASR